MKDNHTHLKFIYKNLYHSIDHPEVTGLIIALIIILLILWILGATPGIYLCIYINIQSVD